MRLINVKALKLEEFLDEIIPPYAILSHTWGSDYEELTFRNVEEGDIHKPCVGSVKFHGCCQQAEKDGFEYAWIDTCCIDKTNLAELSEAINSMFRWYKRASVCYAYLADVSGDGSLQEQRSKLQSSRWFRRGWTLQELLAPKSVQFYNSDWHRLGTKALLCSVLYQITGVPHRFLRGIADLHTASVAQRMSWAAQRETKRKEDLAYCLLGIFDVTMPMIYGEGGEQAFFRLQEQIMKKTSDNSLLAWGLSNKESSSSDSIQALVGRILAAAPSDFANSRQIVPRKPYPTSMNSLVISGGSLRIYVSLVTTPDGKTIGLLNCGPERDTEQVVGIPLSKISPGSDEYFRPRGCDPVLQPITGPNVLPKPIYIRNDDQNNAPAPDESGQYLLYDEEGFSDINLSLVEVSPQSCWDEEQALIMPAVKHEDGHATHRILARFRYDEEGSYDFVVVIELGNIKAQCYVIICSRDTSLERLPVKLRDMIPRIPRDRSASNGLLHLHVTLEPDERQQALTIRPEAVPRPPDYTIDATAELQKLDLMLELEQILEEAGRAEAEEDEAIQRVEEKKIFLEQMKREREMIEDEQRKLEEKKIILVETERNEVQEMRQLNERQVGAKERQEHTHRRRLSAQKRCNELWEMGGNRDSFTSENMDGQAPLGWAAQNGHVKMVHLVLNSGIDVESKFYGASPLSWAARQGHETVVRLLIDRGADIESRDKTYSATPLLWAVRRGHKAIVRLLLDRGADIDPKDDTSRTPLSWAASEGHDTLVRLLIDGGADSESKDEKGLTPLSWAVLNGHETVVKLLLTSGVNVKSKDRKGLMSLSYAVSNGYENVVRLFLNNSNDIRNNTKYGLTALSYIVLNEYEAALRLLSCEIIDIESKDTDGWTLLLLAASKRHETIVQLLLDKKANIESENPEGLTALSIAASNGYPTIVQLLLDGGANIESKDKEGRTPLSLAALNGHCTVVHLLIVKGADIESKDTRGRTPLSIASLNGHENVIQLLLDRGANVESRNTEGRTPLSLAASKGHGTVVQLLLRNHANIETKDANGQTPLSVAASNGEDNVVRLLFIHGTNIESRDTKGQTPLSAAVSSGHQTVVLLLLIHGANIESKNAEGWTPLSLAASNGYETIVLLLLSKGADIESKDIEGWTPLSLAVSNSHEIVVQLLLINHANIESKDTDGWTPLLVAASNGYETIVLVLLANGANIESKDKEGQTPLSLAASNGHETVVQLLLDGGANVYSKNKEGQTPLSLAKSNGQDKVVRLLE
jgi:ankyrin repeat protein